MTPLTLTERLTRAARELKSASDPDATMQTAVELATSNVPGCDAAGISLATRDGGIRTPAASDSFVLDCDLLQDQLRQGPCLEAAWEETVVHSPDVAADERWPDWGQKVAAEHGIGSVLCLKLFTHEDVLGALNLYSRDTHVFDADGLDEATALAAHIAIAVSSAETQQQLREAIDTRTLIGQAVGIVMERYRLDAGTAFQVLVRTSSHANVKVRDIAAELVETGNLRGTSDDVSQPVR